MAITSNDEKLKRLEIVWNTIKSMIDTKTPFHWSVVLKEHKVTWCSGAHSIGAILRDVMGIVEKSKTQPIYIWSAKYYEKNYDNTGSYAMAVILMRQIDGWVSKRKEKEVPAGLKPYAPVAMTVDFTQLEVFALKEVLNNINGQRQHNPSVMMIVAEIMEKLGQ